MAFKRCLFFQDYLHLKNILHGLKAHTAVNNRKDFTMKKDYKEKITNQIISALEQGQIPWISPFEKQIIPVNYLTKRPYNGVNLLSLWVTGMIEGYTGNYWIGFKQANQLGGRVKKGEKGTPITICCPLKPKDEDDISTGKEIIRHYYKTDYVFNLYSQIEGIDFEADPPTYRPIIEFETLIKRTGMRIKHQGERAYYSLKEDFINMPFKSKFKTRTAYYQTLAHELIHATMKEGRCGRNLLKENPQSGRALEELTAELGSAYLLAEYGLKADIQNSAAYIQSWIKALKNDTDYIFKASKMAKDALKWLVNQ